MSAIVFHTTSEPTRPFGRLLAWIRRHRTRQNASAHVPDSFLADTGLRREDIKATVDRGVARIGLLDLGWQAPRRPGLRS